MSSSNTAREAPPNVAQPNAAAPGLVERTLTRLFLRPARVISATTLSARFRLIDLEGVTFEGNQWSPGQKVQIKLDGGFMTRTYTPMRWDAARGVTRIVAFAHGEGPGSNWVCRTGRGDALQVFGPRRSLDLAPPPVTSVVFGDETSFGLVASLGLQGSARAVFEVGAIAESLQVLQALGIQPLALMERRTDDSHLAELQSAMLTPSDASTQYVLTGKASSIRQMGRALKAQGIEARRIKAKAYWAPGKSGLD
ncbi:siderophore-interacting protein [Variovorax sp. H27-G14]|uniref:siderophore-interacting protein n=1 Tax=Variovorax sp. H27-G14 TaxID=3111914 RepID=UPI0038FC7751